MEIEENIAGLGKNHDKEAKDNDLAKKQSEAKPAAENLDMTPNSVNAEGNQSFSKNNPEKEELHSKAEKYAQKEHDKAKDWENTKE